MDKIAEAETTNISHDAVSIASAVAMEGALTHKQQDKPYTNITVFDLYGSRAETDDAVTAETIDTEARADWIKVHCANESVWKRFTALRIQGPYLLHPDEPLRKVRLRQPSFLI